MVVLVTGGTGFIGSHLVDRLTAEGHRVLALVRDPARPRWLGERDDVRFVRGDLDRVPPLPPDLQAVFHLAGLTKTAKPGAYYTVNRAGTANLCRALLDQGLRPRFVYLSSVAAGGPMPGPGRPRREDDPAAPVSPYGRSKRQGEEEVIRLAGRLPSVILRVGAVYGPRDEDFLRYFRWIRRGLLPHFGRRVRPLSVIHVRDLVDALMRAARSDASGGEVFNIAAETPSSWEEIGECAARVLGRRAVRVRVPMWAAFLAAAAAEGASRLHGRPTPLNRSKYADLRQPGWAVDVAKAASRLGFRAACPLEEGLRETLDWYIRRGLL